MTAMSHVSHYSPADTVEIVFDKLAKQRRRDDRKDDGNWRGVSEIAGWVKLPKATVRKALQRLSTEGRVERFDACNGVYWRGLPQHDSHVEALIYHNWCNGSNRFDARVMKAA